jgi:hypothetical protein
MGAYATELSWLAAWQLAEVPFEVLFEVSGEEFGKGRSGSDIEIAAQSNCDSCLITVGIHGDTGRGQILQH